MPPFALPVTAWTAVLLGSWIFWLSLRVISHRRQHKVVLGDEGDRVLTKKIRGHANAVEYIPMSLILLGLAESLMPGGIVAILAVILVVGRVSHGLYFSYHGLPHQMRLVGMLCTQVAFVGLLLAVVAGLVS